MKVLYAAAVLALVAGPVVAQTTAPVTRYGEEDKPKSPAELANDRAAESAYKKSLSNVPDARPTDPWGTMRSDSAPKPAAKAAAPAKRTKSTSTAN